MSLLLLDRSTCIQDFFVYFEPPKMCFPIVFTAVHMMNVLIIENRREFKRSHKNWPINTLIEIFHEQRRAIDSAWFVARVYGGAKMAYIGLLKSLQQYWLYVVKRLSRLTSHYCVFFQLYNRIARWIIIRRWRFHIDVNVIEFSFQNISLMFYAYFFRTSIRLIFIACKNVWS